jgi:hypothetical protein
LLWVAIVWHLRTLRVGPVYTSGDSLPQALLYVVLKKCPLLLGAFEAVAHFVEDVEVVLYVLKRAVLRESVQEGFDLLFGGGYPKVRVAWRPQSSGLAKGGEIWGTRAGRPA